MVAEHENSALAKQLFAKAITRYGLEPGTITVHSDRGAPMTAVGFVDLLAQLGVDRSLSRPRVSNDNPFSEACFKTVKYQPDYPGGFHGVGHARRWMGEILAWYARRHRHTGHALFTPADVFFGRVPSSLPRANKHSTPPINSTPSASCAAVHACACLLPRSPSTPSTQAPRARAQPTS